MNVVQKPDNARLIAVVQLVQAVNLRLNQFYQHWVQHAQLQISNKFDDSPLTEADIAAHHMIERGLSQFSPHYPVLSEESSEFEQRHQWQNFWLVDPLDGTKEFVKKTGEFTVNIALIEDGDVSLAVIGVPTLDQVYIGEKGGAVYRVDAQGASETWHQLHQMPVHDEAWKIAITRSSDKPAYELFKQHMQQLGQAFEITNAGSAYKFCLMLEGKIDAYPRLHPTSEWDTASGQGLLEMLGGGLYDLTGKPFRYNQRAQLLNNEFVAVRDATYLQKTLRASQAALSEGS